MKIFSLVSWTLAVAGVIYLIIGIILYPFNTYFANTNFDHQVFSLVISQFASNLVYGLSPIVLALVITYVGDLRDAMLRKWSESRPIEGKPSFGECISVVLKICAVLWMALGAINFGITFFETSPNDPVLVGISLLVQILITGCSGLGVALIFEKVSASSTAKA